LASAHNSGFDLELNYRRDVNLFGRDSRISLRSFTTYIVHNSVTTPGSPPSTTDQASAVGRVVSLLMLGYETGPWRMGVQEHYVHGGRFSVQYPEFGNNRGPGQATTDISLTRKMGGTKWEMYGSVINLFDRNPGAYPYSSVNSGSGTSGAYDTQGRRFQIGARFKL
jgi:iron complex outermembrane receptor protein